MSFSNLGLSDKVLAAVAGAGYTSPTPIQEQAIPHVLARRDVLGIAQTGTGKTAAFVLPMLTLLERGRARARMPRTLILAALVAARPLLVEFIDIALLRAFATALAGVLLFASVLWFGFPSWRRNMHMELKPLLAGKRANS